jgi:phosphatidylglycerophosphate synthase
MANFILNIDSEFLFIYRFTKRFIMNDTESGRRDLAIRKTSIAKNIARWLSKKNITPNQISILSALFALLGFFALFSYSYIDASFLLLLAAICIQLRLLCNLFDGMVAMEGGKKTPAGELFNDLPDRISDPLFIIAAGFATASGAGELLAWSCAILAIMTAYIRVLGVSMGCPTDFSGPMAKQHRMALLTGSLLAMFVIKLFGINNYLIYIIDASLLIMLMGLIITCHNRVMGIYHYKNKESGVVNE